MTTKSKTFIFKYDPKCSPERMFANFWKAVEGKLVSVKPNEISSPHIEVLLDSISIETAEIYLILWWLKT